MQKKIVRIALLALFLTGAARLPWAAAQDTAKQGEAQAQAGESYKVEFTVNEMDSGKKINSRSYSMLLRAGEPNKYTDWKRLRVGSRVPVFTEANKFQYMDVGMDIDCRLWPMGNDKVSISTIWDYSSLGSDQGHQTQNPVIRHVRSEVEAVVPMDKPTVISEVDDVASTHRYVFEVKVAKINP
jgi:hypothetical protein